MEAPRRRLAPAPSTRPGRTTTAAHTVSRAPMAAAVGGAALLRVRVDVPAPRNVQHVVEDHPRLCAHQGNSEPLLEAPSDARNEHS